MCGIVGFSEKGRTPDEFPDRLKAMLGTVIHRGPDELGYFFDERVGLGSARLSIIDIQHGTQPIASERGDVFIVFNGEIFNYLELREELAANGAIFRTKSDTEVLLQGYIRWGRDVCRRLNGQFAFCIYDRKNGKLFFARDRFGERPLFYCRSGKAIYFGSEIKSLFASGEVERRFDHLGLSQACGLWTALPEQTVFSGVRQIPPGHWAQFDVGTGAWKQEPYFQLPPVEETSDRPFGECATLLREQLERSVQLRLRSDVEVGTYLSGGLDSTITTQIAKKLTGGNVHSFSVGFTDEAFDESPYQIEAAQFLGTRHHHATISHRDIFDHFPDVIWHSETPQFRAASVPLFILSKLVREKGLKVVLTGEGADEWFLGYNIFKETILRKRLANGELDPGRISELFPYLEHFKDGNSDALVRFYANFAAEKNPGLFSHEPRFSNGRFTQRILRESSTDPQAILSDYLIRSPVFAGLDDVRRAQLIEANTLLAGYLLSTQGDRMTSAHGIEGRCPFLDHNVVEMAWRLPQDYKLHENKEKFILKEAFAGLIPDSISHRPKQPYRAPDLAPFLQNLKLDSILDRLRSNQVSDLNLLDLSFSEKFVRKLFRSGREDQSQRDSQTFLMLYSILLLNEQFIADFRVSADGVEKLINRVIDAARADSDFNFPAA